MVIFFFQLREELEPVGASPWKYIKIVWTTFFIHYCFHPYEFGL